MHVQDGRLARPVALLFASFDTNHDFIISPEELTAGIKLEFARADENHNGEITGFEMTDWGQVVIGDPEVPPNLRSLDPDFSNSVTADEFDAGIRKEFDRMDANHDGYLTRPEMLIEGVHVGMGEVRGPKPSGSESGGQHGGRGGGRRGGGGGGPSGGGGGGPF